MSVPYFVPVLDLLPYWPHDLLAPSDVPMLGRLGQYAGVTEFELLDYEGEVAIVGTLALWDELTLDLPLVDGLQLVVGQPGPNLSALPFELDFGPASEEVEGGVAEHALDLFLKHRPGPYELTLPAIDIGLRFDPEDLRPMRPKVAADLSKGFEPDPARTATQLNFRAAIAVNTDSGLRMETPGDLDMPYSQIGSSDVVLSAQDIVLRLSDAQPQPEGIDPAAFDLDPDWKGAYLGRVQIFNLDSLVEWLPDRLDLEKWFIGRGGVTGKATAILFADDEGSLRSLLDEHRDALAGPEYVWFAYPKGGRADINRDSLYPIVAELTGMRPITQISLDDTWSALRFRALKPGEPPFAPRG